MGLHLSKVSFAYNLPKNKKQVIHYNLSDIDLEIASQNEFIALVGHTGSGKSTLVQLFNALLIASSGKVEINKQIITKKPKFPLKPIRKTVGLVFQFPEYQIFEETVLKDIMFGPKNFGLENPEKIAREVAEVMKITDLLEKSPFNLSGGQMRKVAIAGILASQPDILVLDEPSAGLDPFAKGELLLFLEELNQVYHRSIIIITHDMEIVSRFAKRVLVLKKGKLMYDGDKKELFKNEELVKECNLDYPEVIKIMKHLKEALNLPLDVYQFSLEEANQELLHVLGEDNG